MDLLWTTEAIKDRENIFKYINADNTNADIKFDELILKKTTVLHSFPKIGRVGRISGTFELLIHNKYMVVYEVYEKQIRIFNVVHTSKQWPPL